MIYVFQPYILNVEVNLTVTTVYVKNYYLYHQSQTSSKYLLKKSLKRFPPKINTYVSTIVDMAIAHYYNHIVIDGGKQ
jgi:hypothetical protein